MKILVSDKLGQAGLDLLEATENVSYEMRTGLSKDELIAIMPEYDGLIVRSGTRPDADIIAAGTKLKAIGRAGIGVDNIDLEAASAHKVIVMNTPTGNTISTAEHAFTLMCATARNIALGHAGSAYRTIGDILCPDRSDRHGALQLPRCVPNPDRIPNGRRDPPDRGCGSRRFHRMVRAKL